MCKQGDVVTLFGQSQPNDTRKDIDADRCIAGLVSALNNAGFHTIACCCGHGVRPGNIALHDGRELIISPDYGTSRIAEKAFPPVNPWNEKPVDVHDQLNAKEK